VRCAVCEFCVAVTCGLNGSDVDSVGNDCHVPVMHARLFKTRERPTWQQFEDRRENRDVAWMYGMDW
jgi:hypothetical protein